MPDRIVNASEWTPSKSFCTEYLPRALSLLKEIDSNPEKKKWCSDHTEYTPYKDTFGLEREFQWFIKTSYEEGLVVQDYNDYVGRCTREVYAADPQWVSTLSLEKLLASIALHFRRDYHCNGSLIEESVPSGALLRLFEELQKKTAETNIS